MMYDGLSAGLSSPRRQIQLSFKQRLTAAHRKDRLNQLGQSQGSAGGGSFIEFDPRAELKAKIFRAIISSGDTIQKEIDYKRYMMRCMTPNQANKSIKHFQVHLRDQGSRPNTCGDATNLVISSSRKHRTSSVRYDSSIEDTARGSWEQRMLSTEKINIHRCYSQLSQAGSQRARYLNYGRPQSQAKPKQQPRPRALTHQGKESIELKPWERPARGDSQCDFPSKFGP